MLFALKVAFLFFCLFCVSCVLMNFTEYVQNQIIYTSMLCKDSVGISMCPCMLLAKSETMY